MSAKYDFSSIYLPIEYELKEELLSFGDDIISEDDLFVDYENEFYGREDEPHCTVFYGLNFDHPDQIKFMIQKFQPFTIELGRVDQFCKNYFNVIIVRVYSEFLHELHHQIMNLNYSESLHQLYEPHITIAYTRKCRCQKLIADQTFDGIKLKVDKLVFSSKYGIKTSISLENIF